MTKKTTRRALITSVISMLLCVTMHVGTTFAWFTDSVKSGKNRIVAGNLDIELEYSKDMKSWKSVAGQSDLLDPEALWEPGHTEVVYLRISNLGSLALEYQFSMNVYDKVIGESVLGNKIDLADYLKYGVVDCSNAYADRDAALDAVEDVAINLDNYFANGAMEAGDAPKTLALVVYMPTTVGNEANHKTGTIAPAIELGVELFATQDTVESDSFNNQYDDIALVSDATALADAIAAGKNVMLTNDIAVDANNAIVVADGADIVLDLNGHEINGTSSASGKNRELFVVKGEMSVIGNGTISMVHTGTNMEWNNLSAPFSVQAGVLTLGKGVNVMNFGGTDMAYAVDVNTTLGETVLNVDGATLYSTYIGARIFNNHSTAKGFVNYNSGIIYGAKNGYDIWAQLMNDPAENAVVNIADEITYTTEDKSGKMYYIADDVAYVSTASALQSAITEGKDVVFVSDIIVDKWIMFSETKSLPGQIITVSMNGLTIDGNGHTLTVNDIESGTNGALLFDDATKLNISNLTIKRNCAGGAISLKSGVISNVNFVGGGYGIHPGAGEITVENCTFATADGDAIYFEQERDNLTITGCTFNQLDGENVILLRGDVKFTNNTVNSGRTVNIVSGSPTVTGNNFNNVRLKVYAAATATVSNNTINNLVFETNTAASTFDNNTLSADAQAALDALN